EWLRQPPGGERVGRITLMVDCEARDEARIEQVGVELAEMLGEEHALVDDRARRQRAEIKFRYLCGDRLLFDAAADHVEVALELRVADAAGVPQHDLLDLGPRRVR